MSRALPKKVSWASAGEGQDQGKGACESSGPLCCLCQSQVGCRPLPVGSPSSEAAPDASTPYQTMTRIPRHPLPDQGHQASGLCPMLPCVRATVLLATVSLRGARP